jgi:hypothetical protein
MVFSPIVPDLAADSTAELSQLLLFDTDPQGRAVLAAGFERSGVEVQGTGDLGRARELLRASTAPVLLVAIHPDEPGALSLLREATRLTRQRPLTCLAFGRADLRGEALAAGALAFLPVPIFVNDVVSASRLLSGGADVVRAGSAQIEVSLSLGRIGSVYHLIRVFAVIGRSAVVEAIRDGRVEDGTGDKTGELRFIDGVLTSVDVPPLQGLPALHQILLWENAGLSVKFKKVGRRGRQLSLKPAEVLGECDRFLRDFAHGVAGLGDARTIFAPNAARRPAPQMPSEVIPVLRQFDGRRDLAQILAESPFGIFDTLRIIKRFVGDDAIVPVAPARRDLPGPPPKVEGPAALDVWFRRGSVDGGSLDSDGAGKEDVAAVAALGRSLGAPSPAASASASIAMNSPDAKPKPSAPTRVHGNQQASGAESEADGGPAHARMSSAAPERRRTPHSMVATGELRIPGKTPPHPREAVAGLRLVPGVIVNLVDERTPVPISLSSADVLTPPPVAPSAPVGDRATPAPPSPRRTGTVTRGEIRVSPTPPRQAEPSTRVQIPSVFVDLAPTASRFTANTITTNTTTTTATTTTTRPLPATPRSGQAGQGQARAPLASPLPSPQPDVMRAAAAVGPSPAASGAAAQTPAFGPGATPPVAGGLAPTRASGAPRAHASAFSDVESDFFNREADLYKASSVESFDDLEGNSEHVGSSNPGTGTRTGPRRG